MDFGNPSQPSFSLQSAGAQAHPGYLSPPLSGVIGSALPSATLPAPQAQLQAQLQQMAQLQAQLQAAQPRQADAAGAFPPAPAHAPPQPPQPSSLNNNAALSSMLTAIQLGDFPRSSLWMGELEHWMDETYLRQLWLSYGEQVSIKLVRNKATGLPSGYCFVDFQSPQAAQRALQTLNNQPIPSTRSFFRLNWSSGGQTQGMRFDGGPEYSLFVGDLGREVTDYQLFLTFSIRYPSCKSAKVTLARLGAAPVRSTQTSRRLDRAWSRGVGLATRWSPTR